MPYTGMGGAVIARIAPIDTFAPGTLEGAWTIPISAIADVEVDGPLAAGQWTDDTQLTLALAETLIAEGGLFVPESWAHALVQWLNSEPRAPGLSSLQAAMQLRTGGAYWDEAADPDGAGCGAATRVGPIGLLYATDTAARRRFAVQQALVTHGGADAQAAALAVADAIALMVPLTPAEVRALDGTEFLDSIARAAADYDPEFREFSRCIEIARNLLTDAVEPRAAIRALGVSAWSREAAATALYIVALERRSFESAMQIAIHMTGGAVESIATMVGAIAGAGFGAGGIPNRWRSGVEAPSRLLDAAIGLCARTTAERPAPADPPY